MSKRRPFRGVTILGAACLMGAALADNPCCDPKVVVEIQPVQMICCGITTDTSIVRTITECASGTVPPSEMPTGPASSPPGSYVTTTAPWTGTNTTTVTVPPNGSYGTVPGTVIIETPTGPTGSPPGSYVTTTAPWTGTVTTTTTIAPSGTNPGTVIIQTPCPGLDDIDTLSANGSTGASTEWTVPDCVSTLHFTIIGGGGGQRQPNYRGGYGALISGSVAVTGGEVIRAIAGGEGAKDTAGTSEYGNGGAATDAAGGGGAASAMYLDGTLIVVAGGGGGGSVTVAGGPNNKEAQADGSVGNAGMPGVTRFITQPGTNMTDYLSKAMGGRPGTASSPGAGGTTAGYRTAAHDGNPGNGTNGGDGVDTPLPGAAAGGSGGGGGGYFGGGSGSSLYWVYTGGNYIIPGGGGGGSSFVDSSLAFNVTQGLANNTTNTGNVVVTFS